VKLKPLISITDLDNFLADACEGCLTAEEYNTFLSLLITEQEVGVSVKPYEDIDGGEYADPEAALEALKEFETYRESYAKPRKRKKENNTNA